MAWLDNWLKDAAQKGASDLHLCSRVKPSLRVNGEMLVWEDQTLIAAETLRQHLKELAPESNWKEFEALQDTDFAYEIPGGGFRFRCNYFMDQNGPGAVFRVIPSQIPTVEQLGLPKTVVDLCQLKKGFVLVTGPTGSGKSTTLAALINLINEQRGGHIVTIEDPIEFVYMNKKCLINQRQVHRHTSSFKNALRAALREDPDVVLVGELRDLETIQIALETAETGHLVFGTLHTNTAASAVDRIIDPFPADQQNQIRSMLSSCLKAVVAQTLFRKKGGGRIAAYEVLLMTPAVGLNIREGKTMQIHQAMQMGQSLGMSLMNASLIQHVKNGVVDPVEAYINSVDRKDFYSKLQDEHVPIDISKLPSM